MATPKQIAANRRNAQKSSGPVTAAGKEKVSQNRLSHGLCGPFRVLKTESQEGFEYAVEQLTAEMKAVGKLEKQLVRKMAEAMWARQRAVDFQTGSFKETRDLPGLKPDEYDFSVDGNQLLKFARYEAAQDRIFRHALADLLKLQKERQLREIGFEREKRAQAEETRREKRQQQRDERHTLAVAIDKKRDENWQYRNLKAAEPVAKALQGLFPPEMLQNAA